MRELNNIRPIVRVFSKKKKSKQKCGLYTRLDAFRDPVRELSYFVSDWLRTKVRPGITGTDLCDSGSKSWKSKYFHAEIIYSFWWKKKM